MFEIVPLIVLFPVLGLLFNLFFGKNLREPFAGVVASAAAGLSFLVACFQFIAVLGHDEGKIIRVADWVKVAGLEAPWAFQVDTLSVTMMLVVAGVGTLIHIYSIGYMHGDERFARFFVYMNLFLASMLVLVSANNFLMMFVGWEGVGLCSFLLIGFWFDKDGREGERNSEAARKAFITNRIGDFGFLLAMFLIFREFGTLIFSEVFKEAEATLHSGDEIVVGVTLLLLLGATAKSAQIPLYVWLPDAMAGPTPASALIHAATMVTSGVYMIARCHVLYDLAPFSQDVVTAIGASTALLAGSIAVAQFDIKRVLAYSTISQLGFMIAAVGLGAYTAGIFHLATHAFFKALLFMAAGSVIHGMEHGFYHVDEEVKGFDPQDMRFMGDLRRKMPKTFAVYGIGALALAGIPPLAGFFSKDEILASAADHNLPAYVMLSIAAFFTAFYMGRQVLMVFWGNARTESANHAEESSDVMLYPMMGLAFLAVIGGLMNFPGLHFLTDFLEHTFEIHEHVSFNPIVALLSTVLAGVALWLAYQIYDGGEGVEVDRDPLTKLLGPFFMAMNGKFWIDELYYWFVIFPFNFLSMVLEDADRTIFYGFDRLVTREVKRASNVARVTQTGYLSWNIIGIIAGLIILTVALLWEGLR